MSDKPVRQRTRQKTSATEAVTKAEPIVETGAPSMAGEAKKEVTENTAAPRKRIQFQRNGTDLAERPNLSSGLRSRPIPDQVSELTARMSPGMSPGATPLAIIDENGHIMPFDQNTQVDRLVLATVPGITYIYTYADLRRAQEINNEKIRQRLFHETVQGARMFVEPRLPEHGFRNGAEVVSAFYDETRMVDDAPVIEDLNRLTLGYA